MRLLQFLVLFFIISNGFALSVSPTRVNLAAEEPVGTLNLNNDSNELLVLQLQIRKWTQSQYKEIETPNDDILVTPQIFTLKPHSSQLIRIGMEKNLTKSSDQAYRLFIQEVKSSFKLKKEGVYFLFNFSVPVIINANAPPIENLLWKIKTTGGKSQLFATNNGNKVIFINRIGLLSNTNNFIAKPFSTFSYLLPGSVKKWPLPVSNTLPIRRIQAKINGKMVTGNVG